MEGGKIQSPRKGMSILCFFSFLLQLKFHNSIYSTIEKICYVLRWLQLIKALTADAIN